MKILLEIMTKITPTKKDDKFRNWIRDKTIRNALILDDRVSYKRVSDVIRDGYGRNLDAVQLGTMGRDPILIAYARKDPEGRAIVTTEVRKPSKRRQNRKIPDVRDSLGIRWCGPFELKFSC